MNESSGWVATLKTAGVFLLWSTAAPAAVITAGFIYMVAMASANAGGLNFSTIAEYVTAERLRIYGAHLSWVVFGLIAWWHVERARRMSLRLMLDHNVSLADARRFILTRVFQASILAVWGPVAVNFLLGQGLPFRHPHDLFENTKFKCGGD
ncbi:MAG: hypothetical protein U0105_11435 [Candidatus Obscuribacterales bacterium]